MYFKEDWEQVKKRFEAFWAVDMLDRCCIAVTAPRGEPLPCDAELREPADLMEQWTSPELAYATYTWALSYGYLGGEALPMLSGYLGPGVVAAFVGSDYTLRGDTVWYGREPVLHDLANRKALRLNEDHELWKAVQDLTSYYAERAPGRHVVGMTDLGGNLDVAASLRGTQQLIYDLIDTPSEIMKLVDEIDEVWFRCFDRLYDIIYGATGGMTAWMPLWYPGRWYPLQCDFSANLSPSIFEEYVLPALVRESSRLDRAIYHLDGPDALKYVDCLLDVGTIHGIQWVPGETGVPESSVAHDAWFPLYKKIQAKKKCLVLLDVKPAEVEKILSRLSAKGLFMNAQCTDEDEARELLRLVEKWSRA